MKRFAFVALCALAAQLLTPASTQGVEVGVYNATLDGGNTSGGAAIINSLKDAGISIEDFANMSISNLLKYRVVIIPNTSALARGEDPRWVDNLRAYVAEAGGAVVFCHDAIGAERSPFGQVPLFPEILDPATIKRSESQEAVVEICPLSVNFAYLPGYDKGQRVKHMYYDRFVFTQVNGLTLLSEPGSGMAIVGVGEVGRGRVVFNGMFGGIRDMPEARCLEGIDDDVMVNTIKWCLAGKGPIVSDASQVKVAPWRPSGNARTGTIAVIGSSDVSIRVEARAKIVRAGIEHDFLPFNSLRGLSVQDYELAIILFRPYHGWEKLPNETYQALTDYIKAGGKAIIFIPAVMGDNQNAPVVQRLLKPLAGIRLMDVERWNESILQAVKWSDAAGNTFDIKGDYYGGGGWFQPISEPDADGAKTIGYWVDSNGAAKSPAIIKTGFGYIVQLNQSTDHRLFTANAAVELVPGIGSNVFANLMGIYEQTKARLEAAGITEAGREILNTAEDMRRQAEAAAASGKLNDANNLIIRADWELAKAYAVSIPDPAAGEKRMAFVGHIAQPVEFIFERLKKAGFNGVEVSADSVKTNMLQYIDCAHKHGLEFGVGIMPFTIHASSPVADRAAAEDWRIVPASKYSEERGPFKFSHNGRLDPCRLRPEVVDFAVSKALAIIEKYPVDYIYFDYIRWGRERCYCDFCREKFQADTGIKVENWPDDVLGKYREAYNDFYAAPITEVVRRTSEHIARINPKIKLGVYTRRGQREAKPEGQYWWAWGDYVDYVSPMIYMADNKKVEELFAEISGQLPAEGRARLLPILAPPGDSRGGDAFNQLEQLRLQRKYAPAGISYFSYATLHDDFLELLRIGPFRENSK